MQQVYFSSEMVNTEIMSMDDADLKAFSEGATETEALVNASLAYKPEEYKNQKIICLASTVAIVAAAIILGLLVSPFGGLVALTAIIPIAVFIRSKNKIAGLKADIAAETGIIVQKLTRINRYYSNLYNDMRKEISTSIPESSRTIATGKQILEDVKNKHKDSLDFAQKIIETHKSYYHSLVGLSKHSTLQGLFMSTFRAIRSYSSIELSDNSYFAHGVLVFG